MGLMITDTVEIPVFVEHDEQAECEWIKACCEECSLYEDCPRMRGESQCHGKKVPLTPTGEE